VIFDPVETMSVDERTALQDRRLRLLVDRLVAAGGQRPRTCGRPASSTATR
jgi:hypothetical protein